MAQKAGTGSSRPPWSSFAGHETTGPGRRKAQATPVLEGFSTWLFYFLNGIETEARRDFGLAPCGRLPSPASAAAFSSVSTGSPRVNGILGLWDVAPGAT